MAAIGELQRRLIAWLRNQLITDRDEGEVTKLELAHLPLGQKKGQEVSSIKVMESKPGEGWYEDTADEIAILAQGDADGIGGVQSYCLLAYRGARKTPTARFTFRVASEEDTESIGYSSEPPTEKGIIAQLTRHIESKERSLTSVVAATTHTQQRMIAVLSEQVERLFSDRFDNLETVEALLTAVHQRELENSKEEHSQKMREAMIEEVKLLGPAVVEKLTGKQLPGRPSTDTQSLALRRFIESLSEDQRATILGSLSQSQQIALMTLAQSETKPQPE